MTTYDQMCEAELDYYDKTGKIICYTCELMKDMFTDGPQGITPSEVFSLLSNA